MKNFKGYGFFVVMLFVIIIAYISSDYFMNAAKASYTYAQFKQDLSSGMVKSVEVLQNAEVPTGELRVKYSKETKSVYVPDVNDVLEFLEQENFTQFKVSDIGTVQYDVVQCEWRWRRKNDEFWQEQGEPYDAG